MEFEGDCEEYGDEDWDEGTVAPEFSKQSITTHLFYSIYFIYYSTSSLPYLLTTVASSFLSLPDSPT
jgi:hypothetical protein